MRTELTVRVHRHYIATTVRFWRGAETYIEYRLCNKDFPLDVLDTDTAEELEDLCKDYIENRANNYTFADFPYPAYLELSLLLPSSDDIKRDMAVTNAKYADTDKGVINFADTFTGSLINPDLRRAVVRNIFAKIGARDATALVSIVSNLRKASKHNTVKV